MRAIETFSSHKAFGERLRDLLVRNRWLIFICLLLLNLILLISSAYRESLTYDEVTYIGLGKYIVETRDVRVFAAPFPSFPPLLNSLFLYFLEFDSSFWKKFPELYSKGYQSLPLIYQSGYSPDLLIFLSRLPTILTFPLLALLVFAWSRKLFGEAAGFFALFLTLFCPNLTAHARLATTDFLTALTIFAAIFFCKKFMEERAYKWLVLCGVVSGIAFVTKFTAFVLFPIYFLFLFMIWRGTISLARTPSSGSCGILIKRPGNSMYGITVLNVAFILGIALFTVWACYLFEFRPLYVPAFARENPDDFYAGLMKVLYEKKVRLPAVSYVIAVYGQIFHNRIGHPSFLFGSTSTEGHWYYFPFAFLIKTPIPTSVFIFFSLLMFLKRRHRYEEEAFLLIPVAILLLVAIQNRINIGLRLILPMFPFLFVWVSRVVNARPFRFYHQLLALLLIWYVGCNLWIYPHYLEYFNELIGGPSNGHKYLVDSNLDWGQDLRLMKEYVERKRIRSFKLIYFGAPGVAEYSGFHNSAGECGEVREGYVIISATFLHNLYLAPNCYDWLKKYRPVDRIAYSMFVYEIPPGSASSEDGDLKTDE